MTECQFVLNTKVKIPCRIYNNFEEKIIDDCSQPFELLDGWQICEIIVKSSTRNCKIENICIENQKIDELIYTSWFIKKDGTYEQPANGINSTNLGTWRIVLHSNIYETKRRAYDQLKFGELGQNLLEKYNIFVDLGYKIPNIFPPTIMNFFNYSEGINWHPKEKVLHNPYIPLSVDVPTEKLISLIKDIELPQHTNPKHHNFFIKKILRDDVKPELAEYFSSIGFGDYNAIAVCRLDPGGYVDLHVDGVGDPHLHINLSLDNKGLLKFSQGGICPNGANYIGANYITHTAINFSDQPRYAFMVIFDNNWNEKILQKQKNSVFESKLIS